MPTIHDGTYKLCVSIDRYVGTGTLTMIANDGQGHDGTFRVEVHVNPRQGSDLDGIVNILFVVEALPDIDMPRHFSLPMTGSGAADRFNLIGSGPRGVLVELDASWTSASVDADLVPFV